MKLATSKRFYHSSLWSSKVILRLLEEVLNAELPQRSLQKGPISKSLKNLSIMLTLPQECHHLLQINLLTSLIWKSIQASSKKELLFLNLMEQLEQDLVLVMDLLRSIKRLIWDPTTSIHPTKRARTPKTPLHLKRWRYRRAMSLKCKVRQKVPARISLRPTNKDWQNKELLRGSRHKENPPAHQTISRRPILLRSLKCMSVVNQELSLNSHPKKLVQAQFSQDLFCLSRMQLRLSKERQASPTKALLIWESMLTRSKPKCNHSKLLFQQLQFKDAKIFLTDYWEGLLEELREDRTLLVIYPCKDRIVALEETAKLLVKSTWTCKGNKQVRFNQKRPHLKILTAQRKLILHR